VQSASACGTLMIMHADMVEHRVVCACTEPGADALPVRRALGPFRAPGVLHMLQHSLPLVLSSCWLMVKRKYPDGQYLLTSY
jgi:hypothetical protein